MSMSARQQVAESLGDTCLFGGLNDSYGVIIAKSEANGKSFWTVTFAKAAILDGVIRVYSPNFIQIKWQTAIRDLPRNGSEVFRSQDLAREFLQKTFIRPYM